MQDQAIQAPPAPIKEPWKVLLVTSVLLFIASIWCYVGFSVASSLTGSSITDIEDKIVETNKKIEILENDKDVKIASMLQDEKYIKKSIDLPNILSNFRSIASEYGLRFQWFSIKWDQISTSMVSVSNNESDAIEPILKLMEDYRKNKKTFLLKPIFSINGDPSRRATGLGFEVAKDSSNK